MFWKNLSRIAGVVAFIGICFFTVTKVSAVAPQITAYPSGDISLNQSFTVSATMSGLSKSSIYRLRIALAPTGTSNYFGSTWNGSSWYNGTPPPIDYTNFLSITTDGNGSWWGDVQGEIDPDDPNFTTGGGTYDLKIGRYTQTGSTATWSNIVSVAIVLPPTPTPSPTIPPTATPTPVIPTPKPLPTLTPKPISTPTLTIYPSASFSSSDTSSFGAVLGTSSALSKAEEHVPTLVAAATDTRKTVVNIFPLVFIIVGFFLLASCGILIALRTEKAKGVWKKLF